MWHRTGLVEGFDFVCTTSTSIFNHEGITYCNKQQQQSFVCKSNLGVSFLIKYSGQKVYRCQEGLKPPISSNIFFFFFIVLCWLLNYVGHVKLNISLILFPKGKKNLPKLWTDIQFSSLLRLHKIFNFARNTMDCFQCQ